VREGSPADWLELALAWRAAQVHELAGQALRVARAHNLDLDGLVVVAAGCGAFLLGDVMARLRLLAQRPVQRLRMLDYGRDIACRLDAHGESESGTGFIDITAAPSPARLDAQAKAQAQASWARVCAPCVAVAALWQQHTDEGAR
jgi:hypothetical protein